MQRHRLPFILSSSVLLLSACTTTDSVVFVTKTSIGIDVDGSTPGASVAYDRVEGYLAPRYNDNSAPPVYASFATNGNIINERKIRQVYATGKAARTVSATPGTPQAAGLDPQATQATASRTVRGGDAQETSGSGSTGSTGSGSGAGADSIKTEKAMFFGTSTTLGLKVGFTGGSAMNSFTFGFKRKEFSLIPEVNGANAYPSTLASFDNDTQAAAPNNTELTARQFFATGDAAENLAASRDIQRVLHSQAANALADYREEERQQTRSVLQSLTCVAQLPDAKLATVWDHAEALELFDTANVLDKIRAATPHDARAIYTDNLSLYKAASPTYTVLLRGHADRVCKLARGG